MGELSWLQPGEGREFPLRLKTRLRAWWEGYDISVLKMNSPLPLLTPTFTPDETPILSDSQGTVEGEPMMLDGRPLWTASRAKVAEQIWGEGFVTPGGAEHALYLAKPLCINSKMSVLDLAAGMGGAARTLAKEFKAYITGMEASKVLAELGNERSHKEGLGKQATIHHYDPSNMMLEKRFDAIYAKESFFTVPNKEELFAKINAALKSGGQFTFTDYGIEGADMTSPEFVSWMSSEPQEPHLWTMDRIVQVLKANKLDVRTNEDITPLQRKLVLGSMAHFVQHLEVHRMDNTTKLAVIEEIELWARRVAAFNAGLRVFRFHCMKH